MRFSLRTPAEILFGPGEARRVAEVVSRYGKRVFLVTGSSSLERTGFLDSMSALSFERYKISGEPEVAGVDEGARRCREADADVVLAVGGGSALDTAKAVSAMATNDGSVLDYLEGVGAGRPVAHPPLPFIAVPTTAGSGSEATKNAVIRVPEKRVKRSIRHDLLLPRVAIVDPELSGNAPRDVAASAGLDALTHLIESYVSNNAQPTTDALALPGIRLAARGLKALASGRADADSREAMALASLWGGITLANAGLGAVHGIVAPLGGRCAIAHGIGCACLLVETVHMNIKALREREPENPALSRYAEIASAFLPGNRNPESVGTSLASLRRDLGIPTLSRYGVKKEDVAPLVRDSRGSSMKYNPIVLTDEELEQIVTASIG